MSVYDAINAAKQQDLDLVEVGPNANPPVCKIIDYGKFKYEQEKNQQKNKVKNRAGEIKEIRFSPSTDEHDFNTKIEKARKFGEKGYKIRITVMLSGRENIYSEKALDQIERVRQALELEYDQRPSRMGTRFSALLVKGKKIKEEDAKDQN
mgnify:FL=1